jgi:hypothetical protein
VHRYEIQELLKDAGNTYTYIKEVYARVANWFTDWTTHWTIA